MSDRQTTARECVSCRHWLYRRLSDRMRLEGECLRPDYPAGVSRDTTADDGCSEWSERKPANVG